MHPKNIPLGQVEAYVVKEHYVAEGQRASREGAVACGATYKVATAVTCGGVIKADGFQRSIDGMDPSRSTVTFLLENSKVIDFQPFDGERISLKELMERLENEKWMSENLDHPLAFAYWAVKNYAALIKAIRTHAPILVFQKGKFKANVVVGGPRPDNEFVLEKAGFSPSEIKEILSSLP